MYVRFSIAHVWRAICMMLAVAMLVATTPAALAQEPQLVPTPSRMTDEAQYHDQTVYQVLEQRLKGLNERGHKLSDYDMAKAQCWVDVSFHEYTRNDRSAFPDQSVAQAEAIIEALENNQPASQATPLINDATRLRPDLWAQLDQLKAGPHFACAAQAIACAEVELVHAGSEYAQFGWRHANPYVEIAEDAVNEANEDALSCKPPLPASTAAAPAGPVARIALRADALFAFKSARLTKAGMRVLDGMIDKIPERHAIGGVAVVGYTDRIDVHHDPRNNQRLSEARAKSVADYLAKRGLDAAKLTSYGRGSENPVVTCEDVSPKNRAKLYACLAPNRRVEVVVTGVVASGTLGAP